MSKKWNATFPLLHTPSWSAKALVYFYSPRCGSVRSAVNTTNSASKRCGELTDLMEYYEFSFRAPLFGIYSTPYAPD
jgi:hypothetical protein